MDALDDITYRMRVCKLESALALREIEQAALTREIGSPSTIPARKVEAIERRDESLTEWSQILTELTALRNGWKDL